MYVLGIFSTFLGGAFKPFRLGLLVVVKKLFCSDVDIQMLKGHSVLSGEAKGYRAEDVRRLF